MLKTLFRALLTLFILWSQSITEITTLSVMILGRIYAFSTLSTDISIETGIELTTKLTSEDTFHGQQFSNWVKDNNERLGKITELGKSRTNNNQFGHITNFMFQAGKSGINITNPALTSKSTSARYQIEHTCYPWYLCYPRRGPVTTPRQKVTNLNAFL